MREQDKEEKTASDGCVTKWIISMGLWGMILLMSLGNSIEMPQRDEAVGVYTL